ncbi:MAG TPA: response regulator [Candidatus Saccharimonadales bacterium]|nr:response regulator [Candidatus Saccharimonadales bacterium]
MDTTIKTILCIEDDPFIGDMYARSLRKSGYDVKLVTSGQLGVDEALKNTYDLILLDILLPEKQGTEVLKVLRGDTDKVPNSRILVLTNFSQDKESRLAMESKADGYLIKADITPRKLIEIIKSMTRVV